jgi:hypothetical protein
MFYINLFAAIAASALCLHIFKSFWLPLCIGVCVVIVLGRLLGK